MVLLVIVLMGVFYFAGVLLASAIGYGLFRWIGSAGAWIGVAILTAGIGFMLYILRDNLVTQANGSADSRLIASWACWALGIPLVTGVLLVWWLGKLALSK